MAAVTSGAGYQRGGALEFSFTQLTISPGVRTMMQTYGVSDGTVKRAMRELRDQGLIRTYQGRGSFKA